MIARRDLLVGAGCAAALGAAEYLRPRRALKLLRDGETMARVIPGAFAGWSIGEGGDIVMPETPGSLASRLYSDRVARTYRHADGDGSEEVMLLAAYGAAQSDVLQLHRPEVCYPAVGFTIKERRLVSLPVAPGVTVPAVLLSAQAGGRMEDVAYWTRLGDDLPQTGGDQRWVRLRAAMAGYVGDGVLVRASMLRRGGEPSFPILQQFLSQMLMSTAARDRAALIGRTRADALARV
ncbi:exosortase-associated protein EpsI, V-type [Sphingomonas corticis]|jgi:EpsI family protein|uniref:EpsI family protein n=1 Tax=Sphingomonas corticis TaxID=2722791 RepID=A0ABX1CNF1_9SPHN|nr:exosortase-associated protein EpsI, V-type [Sphingomonas corticis]NJR77845.1 EpsI family protein [Sphingomonas corticis]